MSFQRLYKPSSAEIKAFFSFPIFFSLLVFPLTDLVKSDLQLGHINENVPSSFKALNSLPQEVQFQMYSLKLKKYFYI